MKNMPLAPPAPSIDKPICFVEAQLKPWKDVIADEHPDRIFSSTDPRWDVIRETKPTLVVQLTVAHVRLDSETKEFIPKSLKILECRHSPWEAALDTMRKFETDGRIYDTPIHDAAVAAEAAAKAGNEALIASLVEALKARPNGPEAEVKK
jgi:hypothetical protein